MYDSDQLAFGEIASVGLHLFSFAFLEEDLVRHHHRAGDRAGGAGELDQAAGVVLEARENAVPFYESLGYSMIEKSYLLFGEIQHFRMKKALPLSE